ncbi:MAG TPA: hypothetical protein VMU84_09120 [Thermoanaerobaculia bacterium]|nr:hypothetical protein [Thermoanaerobaculia bacterium]
MHTPDDPERAELRATLRELSKALIPLHRALIHATKDDYTRDVEPVSSPGHLLRLVSDDAFFAWLKPLTSLIVDIDEMASGDFESEAVDVVVKRIDILFGTEPDERFTARYVPILQRDVDVAIGHAAIRQARAKLAP